MIRLDGSCCQPLLRDISLGFFYGAKIGVLGLNGVGKSTLLLDEPTNDLDVNTLRALEDDSQA